MEIWKQYTNLSMAKHPSVYQRELNSTNKSYKAYYKHSAPQFTFKAASKTSY